MPLLGRRRGRPTTWNGLFGLSSSEAVAFELMQELWPGAFFMRPNEVLYQVCYLFTIALLHSHHSTNHSSTTIDFDWDNTSLFVFTCE